MANVPWLIPVVRSKYPRKVSTCKEINKSELKNNLPGGHVTRIRNLLKRIDWSGGRSFYTGWRYLKPAVMEQEKRDQTSPWPSEATGPCEQLNHHEAGRWPHWGQPRSAGWPEQQGTSLVICEISSFTTQCLILKKLTKGYCLFQWLNFEQVDFDKNQTCFCSLPCLPIHTNNKQKHILTAIWPMKGLIWTVLQEERPLSIPNHFYLPNHCRRDTTFTVSASQFFLYVFILRLPCHFFGKIKWCSSSYVCLNRQPKGRNKVFLKGRTCTSLKYLEDRLLL